MGLSPKLLGEGESVIFTTRTHIKALVLPVITLILICAATGFLIAVTPGGATGTWLRGFLVLVAVALILWSQLAHRQLYGHEPSTGHPIRDLHPRRPGHSALPHQRCEVRARPA
jgi:hypothetical protein